MNLYKVGQILKKARLQKQWTLQYVSQVSCIREEKIKSLEEGIEDSFSAKIHIRGFIKIYAKILSIPSDSLLEMYPAANSLNQYPVASIEKLHKSFRSFFTITNITVSLLIVALVSLITWTKFQVNIYQWPSFSFEKLRIATSFKVNQKSGDFIPIWQSDLPDRFPLFDSIEKISLPSNYFLKMNLDGYLSETDRHIASIKKMKNHKDLSKLKSTTEQKKENNSQKEIGKLQ